MVPHLITPPLRCVWRIVTRAQWKDFVETANGRVAGRSLQWRTGPQHEPRSHARGLRKVEFRSHVGKKKDLTSCETKLNSDSKILTDD